MCSSDLTTDAIKRASETGPVIFVASGQHRIAALERYQAFLGKTKNDSMKSLRALEKKMVDSVDQMEIDEENTIEKPKRDEIEGSIAFGGEWMVVVYDFSELICPIQSGNIAHIDGYHKCAIYTLCACHARRSV